MYYLAKFCVVCLNRKEPYRKIIRTNTDDAQLLHKLHTCAFVTDFLDVNTSLRICNKCFDTMQIAYEFINKCRENSVVLKRYVAQWQRKNMGKCIKEQIINQESVEQEQIYIEPVEDFTLNLDKLTDCADNFIKEEDAILEEVEQCTIKEEIRTDSPDNDLDIKHALVEYKVPEVGSNIDEMMAGEEKVNHGEEKVNHGEEKTNHGEEEAILHYLAKGDSMLCVVADVGSTGDQQIIVPRNTLTASPNNNVCTKIKCFICGNLFRVKADLRIHMSSHTSKQNFECSVCKRTLTTSSNLKKHMLIHTGEKNFECTVCQKRFTESGALNRHIRIHTGEKKYQCSICKKSFARCTDVKPHMAVHTGEKRYECTVCDKRFGHSSTLRKHMRIHTGEKKYQCIVCEKGFTQSIYMKKHMRTHTG